MSNHIYDVVVIGGGCSGLKAAETLYSNGVDNIILLEAQNQLGGRIRTVLIDDNVNYPVNLGAIWLHGIQGNPLNDLTLKHRDIFPDKEYKQYKERTLICLDQDGNEYDSNVCREVDLFMLKIEEDLEQINKSNYNFEGLDYQEYVVDKFESYIQNDPDDLKRIKRVMFKKTIYDQCMTIGCNKLSDCALAKSYAEFDGTWLKFPGGYMKLIEFLADTLPADAVKLNHAVEYICKNEDNLNVLCQNGQVFITRHIVFTGSLGVLKRHSNTLFEKNLLNDSKINAINKLDIGYYFRAYLVYEDLSFFPSKDSLHLIDFSDTEQSIETKWILKIHSVVKVHDRALVIDLIGDCAFFVEKLEDNEIILKITKLLQRVLRNQTIPYAKQIIRSDWCHNPHIQGCYTYIPTGSSSTHISELSSPICFDNIPKILFAGESTHINYYSTVLGVYLTGETQAKTLIPYLAMDN